MILSLRGFFRSSPPPMPPAASPIDVIEAAFRETLSEHEPLSRSAASGPHGAPCATPADGMAAAAVQLLGTDAPHHSAEGKVAHAWAARRGETCPRCRG